MLASNMLRVCHPYMHFHDTISCAKSAQHMSRSFHMVWRSPNKQGLAAGKLKIETSTQRRSYVVKPNVDKVIFDPTRSLGRVGLVFSREGLEMGEQHSSIILECLSNDMKPLFMRCTEKQIQSELENLAMLEFIVKLVEADPKLSNFKKIPHLRKQGRELASKYFYCEVPPQGGSPDALVDQEKILSYQLELGDLLCLKAPVLKLRLPFEFKATVETWWMAYLAVMQLKNSKQLFSTIFKCKVSEVHETQLFHLYVQYVHARIYDHIHAEASANQTKPIFDPVIPSMPEIPRLRLGDALMVRKWIEAETKALEALSEMYEPLNMWTVEEYVHQLINIRNRLRQIAMALFSASVRKTKSESSQAFKDAMNYFEGLHIASSSISELDLRNAINTASSAFKYVGAPINTDSGVIRAHFPECHGALDAAIRVFSTLAEGIKPADLNKVMMKRFVNISRSSDPLAYDAPFAAPSPSMLVASVQN